MCIIRILIGQIAVGIVALLGLLLGIMYCSDGVFDIGFPLLVWTLCLIALGIWTFRRPTIAFVITLLFYIASICIKYILNDGEYLFLYLVHFYFIVSVVIGILGGEDMRLKKLEESNSENKVD